MRENRDTVHVWLGLSEGGYVNDPQDPGGETNLGVTIKVWRAWLQSQGQRPRSLKTITLAEARAIFEAQYFEPVWFDRLPSGLDYSMADYAVNSGPNRAVKDLQRTLNAGGHQLKVDGHMGLVSLAAVTDTADLTRLIIELNERRFAFMKSLRHWPRFKGGWTTRVMGKDTTAGAQIGDIGVIDRSVRMAQGRPAPAPQRPTPGRAEPTGGLIATILAMIAGLFR